jgi:ATP-dependent exoDNAse (exonuclease V) beta subunit
MPDIDVVRIAPLATRPRGRRFGTLVHSVLASVPLTPDKSTLTALAISQARLTGATDEETSAAIACVAAALSHPIFERARAAVASGRCRREVPVIYRADDEVLLEGVIDLAFEEAAGWTVVDFKTNDPSQPGSPLHRRQLAHYMTAVSQATARHVAGVILYL